MENYLELIKKKLYCDIGYSFRRYHVDKFYFENISIFKENAQILDIGGKKEGKRGCFDLDKYNFNVQYANIAECTNPDFLCDASTIPVNDNSFDGVILSEVLEHIENPLTVLNEVYRILKPGGIALICTPFMFHVHADPFDFGRYTDYWYKVKLEKNGFSDIRVERQGGFFALLGNLIKIFAYELYINDKYKSRISTKIFFKFIPFFMKRFLIWDDNAFITTNKFLANNTTGFGVVVIK